MKLLRENYDGLQEIITISRDLKAILLEPDIQKALQNNDFDMIYDTLSSNLTSQFTQLMASLNVDPLNYLEYIPKSFLAFTSIEHLDIPEHITRISDYAFRNCYELTDIIIPNQVKRIGNWAFSNCQKLTSIAIPNSVTTIGNYAFYNCSGLTSVTIGNKVKSIRDYAFYRCSSLKSITIPNSVTSIGDNAFYHCSSLTSITIPDSVTSIGRYAFESCTGLTSITIPDSVISIGSGAFYECSELNDIKYTGTKEQWDNIKLDNLWKIKSAIKTIHCSDGDIEL